MVWLQILTMLGMGWLAPAPAEDHDQLEVGKLNPSARCGRCHEEIYPMWRRSMHGASLSDPIFEISYLRAYWETAGEARKLCLRCHAPGAVLTKDFDLRDPISREGISCDYCHSIASVDLARREMPFQVKLDGVKRGPLGDADSPVHKVAKSALHESADFCAGCHEYATEAGLPILSTYSEWKSSPQAAEGKTCQHCHMPFTPGETVRPGLGPRPRKRINLHDISGMHSTDQVRRAATARILRLGRDNPRLAAVEVEVSNIGSGHSIPTGLPTRKLILEVVFLSDNREVRRFERIYQKTLLDAQGRPITADHHTMLFPAAIQDDNRLRAGERRVERFVSPVPRKGELSAEVQLRYFYQPEVLSPQPISIDIATDRSP